MARNIRFTFRMTNAEYEKMRDIADRQHVIPSVAIRQLIAQGIRSQKPKREVDGGGCAPETLRSVR
jgi:hypothetical protein